ncbi:MAG: methyl-accepting chemotaxis protein [Desulfuromonas sp.]|nr:methyl-accepting chemotaxis protein [Desulfuromonas sp.]
MAEKALNTLSIKQIAGRSIISLSFMVVLVLGTSVATYIYLTQLAQQQTEVTVANLTLTEQLSRNGSDLQALEGKLTVAALSKDKSAIDESVDRLSDHMDTMMVNVDKLIAATATGRYEIQKVANSIYEIYSDISVSVDEVSDSLLSGASVNSQLEHYAKLNQDVREFNSALGQLEKLFVKVIGLQQQKATQDQIYYGGAAALLLLLLLFVYLGFHWNKKLDDSLQQLRMSIERALQGDLSAVKLNAKDEIATTALLYNSLIEKYKDAIIADTERETTQENLIGFLEVVSEAADGDLTMKAPVTADAFGSIADAYNLMVESLSELLKDTKLNANDVGEQSRNLIRIFQDMEMGAETQSSQVVKATEIVNQSEIAARDITEKAALAQQVANQVDRVTAQGSNLVNDNIEGMQLIRVTVQVINKKMKSLSERLLEIGTISQLISEIATRTTILAMNASIEASRAGEQGRGFLVISDEIKRLADKSAEATKQIGGVIKSIQSEANEVTLSLEEETKTVETQSKLAQDTGESFSAIQEAISQSRTVVDEITALSKDQFAMTRNVEAVMKQVSEISSLTLQQVKDSAAITTGLSAQSGELLSSIDAFRLAD